MNGLVELITSNDTWLQKRVLSYARKTGDYKKNNEQGDSLGRMVSKISKALIENIQDMDRHIAGHDPRKAESTGDTADGPFSRLVYRAEKELAEPGFCKLVRYLKQSCLDLIDKKVPDPGQQVSLKKSILAFFGPVTPDMSRDTPSDKQTGQPRQKLEKTTRALAILSACNEAIIKAGDEAALLGDVCRIIVNMGGYRLAWIGEVKHDREKNIVPAAAFGPDLDYIEDIAVTWADAPTGRGPTGIAVRTGMPYIAWDIAAQPEYEPWRDKALERGLGSSMAVPIAGETGPVAVLNIYSGRPDDFSQQEAGVFLNLAGNLFFGIRNLRLQNRQDERGRDLAHKYRLVAENLHDGVFLMGPDMKISYANPALAEILGCSQNYLIGRRLESFMPPEDYKIFESDLGRCLQGIKNEADLALFRTNGAEITTRFALKPYKDEYGRYAGIVVVVNDVTRTKKAEQKLKDSLDEKENQLITTHHRFNNNLQILSSLLRLQSQYVKDKNARRLLEQSHYRVRALAIVHESVLSCKDPTSIDVDRYIHRLAAFITHSRQNRANISLELDLESRCLDMNKSVPCGLIAAELISNAYEHAFPEREGTITVCFRTRGKQAELIIEDNGVGLPKDIVLSDAQTLGLQMAVTLAGQMGGVLNVLRRKGTRFTLSFPV